MAKYNFDARTVAPLDLWTAVGKEMKARGLSANRLGAIVTGKLEPGSDGTTLLSHLKNPTAFAPTSYMRKYVDWLNNLEPVAIDMTKDEAEIMAAKAMAEGNEEKSMLAIADGIHRELQAIRKVLQQRMA